MIVRTLLLSAVALTAVAGPVEFGQAEFERALAERGLNAARMRIKTEVATDPPESYRIAPGLITGGDLRGVMYGLLEAAAQIRSTGRLRKANAVPALAIRGIRMTAATPGLLDSRDAWPELFQSLARGRFNRFNLVISSPWEATDALQSLSQTAADYGVDFTLGLWSAPVGQGGEEFEATLAKLLSACPAIRSVQLRLDAETAAYAVRAVHDAGRRITIEVPAEASAVAGAATSAGVPLRVSAEYPAGPPAGLQIPFFWEMPRAGAPAARDAIERMVRARSAGFEIDVEDGTGAAAAIGGLRWGRLGYDPQAR